MLERDKEQIAEMLGRTFCGTQWTDGHSAPTAHICLRPIDHSGKHWCGCSAEWVLISPTPQGATSNRYNANP